MNAARLTTVLALLAAAWVTGGCLGKNMGDGIYLPGGSQQQKSIQAAGMEQTYLSAGRRISNSWAALVRSGAVPYGWKPVTVWVRLLPDGHFGQSTISEPANPSGTILALVARTIEGAQQGAKPLPAAFLATSPDGATWQVVLDVP